MTKNVSAKKREILRFIQKLFKLANINTVTGTIV
jgi:hypothetical protein